MDEGVESGLGFALSRASLIRGGLPMATFQSIGNFFTRIFGWGGRSWGGERGPQPGDGAVIHHSSGEADFDGLSGDVPPPIKDANRDLPYPRKKSAD
jgi:hypothetical protein